MKDKIFSIIIPVYNVEHYLTRCIDSILQQDFQDFEIILIDDGSNDYSPKICDDYHLKDERVITIHTKNNGVSIARNIGINQSNGKWILFCDSDDWLEKNTLSNAYNIITTIECDIIQSGFRFIYPDKIIELFPQEDNDYNISYLHFCTMIIKKSFLKEKRIFFPEHISFAEDWYFKYSLYSSNPKIHYNSYITYNYFVNSNSVMNNINKKNIMDEIFIINKAENIKSEYKSSLYYQKMVSKDKLLFVLNDIKLWKNTFSNLNIRHLFWSGPKHFIKSCIYLFGLGKNKRIKNE